MAVGREPVSEATQAVRFDFQHAYIDTVVRYDQ